MPYNITRKDVEVFTAEERTQKRITQYELQEWDSGWYIKEFKFDVEEAFPREKNMFIPHEVVENIILKQHVKKELKK